jgi:hypothetical protein
MVYSIYIIKGEDTYKYKIGKWHSDINKLKSRYITPLPNVQIIQFTKVGDESTSLKIEKYFKIKYANNRMINDNNRKSEWYELNSDELQSVKNYIRAFSIEDKRPPRSSSFDESEVKTIYLSIREVQDLIVTDRLKTPQYQRRIDEERFPHIIEYFKENFKNPNHTCISDIVLNYQGGVYYIVDGQHRIFALRTIVGELREQMSSYKLKCRVYSISENKEVQLFRDLNKSVPCPSIHLQEGKTKSITASLQLHLEEKYKKYISYHGNPRVPKFNINTLIDKLTDQKSKNMDYISLWYSEGKIKNLNSLPEAFDIANILYMQAFNSNDGFANYQKIGKSKTYRSSFLKFKEMIRKVNKLSKDNPCYIGVVTMDRFIQCLFHKNILM